MVNISFILFFKEAWIGVSSVAECIILIFCLFFLGNTSIKLPSPLSKTGFLERSLIGGFNRFAKTAPNDVFIEHFLML